MKARSGFYYVSEEDGSVYSARSGELVQHPMWNARSGVQFDPEEGGAVDFERGVETDEERARLRAIETVLAVAEGSL